MKHLNMLTIALFTITLIFVGCNESDKDMALRIQEELPSKYEDKMADEGMSAKCRMKTPPARIEKERQFEGTVVCLTRYRGLDTTVVATVLIERRGDEYKWRTEHAVTH